ncbi:MAG TPA: type II secretion system F family protein [Phycisphaerae bacterium]|nr:type II secretion system F family protein [Phycisphaerales bacterium]HRX85933.1 type II secretion system F family protein [Phycisphaerae bacterium]
MPTIVIPILAVVSVALIVYALMPGKDEEKDRVKRRMIGRKSTEDHVDLRRAPRQSMASKMVQKVAPIAVRPVMPKDTAEMSKLRQKLCSAGFRRENTTQTFLASKTLVAIAGLFAGILYAWMKGYSMSDGIGPVVCFTGLGFMAPNAWLSSVAKKRGEKIKHGLADTLDLMVVAVEAGLGLDAAIQRVSDELRNVHPELSEELQIAILETQMGIRRSEALDNLAQRTMVDELRAMVAMINQAERFGTSIAKALRNQSEALRTKRRQAAEERAQQCAVKLMLPLILFIFPAIFVVLAGPAALSFMESGI